MICLNQDIYRQKEGVGITSQEFDSLPGSDFHCITCKTEGRYCNINLLGSEHTKLYCYMHKSTQFFTRFRIELKLVEYPQERKQGKI